MCGGTRDSKKAVRPRAKPKQACIPEPPQKRQRVTETYIPRKRKLTETPTEVDVSPEAVAPGSKPKWQPAGPARLTRATISKKVEKDTPGGEALTIPEHLKKNVTQVERGVFRYTYETQKLKAFHRLVWSVGKNITTVVVQVAYLRDHEGKDGKEREYFFGFYVELLGKDASAGSHNYIYTNAPWAINTELGQEKNYLTYILSCELFDLLAGNSCGNGDWNGVTFEKTDGLIKGVIESDPGLGCIVCKSKFEAKLWRPATCCDDCEGIHGDWPLSVRASPFLIDTPVLDFLLCCCMSVVVNNEEHLGRGFKPVLAGCPVPQHMSMQTVLNSFTPMPAKDSAYDLAEVVAKGAYSVQRQALLSWLCGKFKGCLVSLPKPNLMYPGVSLPADQLMLMNATPKRHFEFKKNLAGRKKSHGTPAFHGTPPSRLFSIITDALCDMTRRSDMNSGAQGIYYGRDLATSFGYVRNRNLQAWQGSAYASRWVIFGLEVGGPNKPPTDPAVYGEACTCTESDVAVRFVYIIRDQTGQGVQPKFTPRLTMAPHMEWAFKAIHRDELLPAVGLGRSGPLT